MGEGDIALLVILFFVAVMAGLIDAIAGGGGLLTVPALLAVELDPLAAIATNKLQGVFGTASATWTFARARLVVWRDVLPAALLAFAGALAGALTAGFIPSAVLFAVMPFLLVGVALRFALSKNLGEGSGEKRMRPVAFSATLVPAIGFYDGFFGPGAGSFYLLGLVALMGAGIVDATAQTKLLNFASNLGSLIVFAAMGAVVWPAGLAMGAGALLGARLGSRLALRKGVALIRPLLVIVSVAAALRLLANEASPWRGWLVAALVCRI